VRAALARAWSDQADAKLVAMREQPVIQVSGAWCAESK
jgi:hypothetical protein